MTPKRIDELERGIQKMPWTRQFCEQLFKLRWFVSITCMATVFQMAAQTYFNRSLHIWKEQYHFTENLAGWVTVVNYISQAFLAVFLVHGSTRKHRMHWISGSMITLAVTCFILIIPELAHPMTVNTGSSLVDEYESRQVCQEDTPRSNPGAMDGVNLSSLFLLFIFQISLGASVTILHINTLLYIDDHAKQNSSIIYIGTLLAFRELGNYLGVYLHRLTLAIVGPNIFYTAVWFAIVLGFLVCSGLLYMYPKYLNELVRLKVIVLNSDVNAKIDLKSTVLRVLNNRIVVLNIVSTVFLIGAISNFNMFEEKIIQSKFFVPDENLFHNAWMTQLVTSLITPLIVFLVVFASGFMIAKFSVKAFELALWNGLVPLALVMVYLTYLGIGCEESFATQLRNKLVVPSCSRGCECDNSMFEPVCLASTQKTYYSPCHAGCHTMAVIDGMTIFKNCTCGENGIGNLGGCQGATCQQHWVMLQILRIAAATLMGSMAVGHTIINLYSVNYVDRPCVLALEASVVGFVSYLPIRFIFTSFAESTCLYFASNGIDCNFYNGLYFSRVIISITVSLLIFASINGIFLAFTARKLVLNRDLDFLNTFPMIQPLNNLNSNRQVPQNSPASSILTTHDGSSERDEINTRFLEISDQMIEFKANMVHHLNQTLEDGGEVMITTEETSF